MRHSTWCAGDPYSQKPKLHGLFAHRQLSHQGGPDISLLDSELQKQFDHAANAYLGSILIHQHSRLKVWWECDRCPDGHLHRWQAAVYNRSYGTGCPQCRGRKVCQHSCLATKAPWAAAEWDHEANADLGTPDTVLAQSNNPVGWHCQVCSHKWTVSPNRRLSQKTGCPKCASRASFTTHPTFADSQHPLLAEWDYERNEACGYTPSMITLGSSRLIYWLCHNCPAGQEHSWSARAFSRTFKNHGCPYCAGVQACRCNCLQTLYPDIASEWDHQRNDHEPSDYLPGSHEVVWWLNSETGKWQQSINGRTCLVQQNSARAQHVAKRKH